MCFPSAHTAFCRTPSLLASYRRDLHSSPLAHFDIMSDFYGFVTHEVSPCNCLSPASTCLGSRWLTRCIGICYHLTSLLTWENCPDNWSKISPSVGCGMLVIRRGWMTLRRKPRLYVTVILQRQKSLSCNSTVATVTACLLQSQVRAAQCTLNTTGIPLHDIYDII